MFLFSPILHIDLSVSTEEFEKKPEPLPEETAPIQKLDKLPVVSDSSILPLDIIDKTSDQTVNPTEADHATVQFISDIDSVFSHPELNREIPELISDVNEEEKQKEIEDVLPDVMKIYADTVVDETTPQERKQIVDFTVLDDESKNVTFEKDIETTDKDDESKVIDKENIIPVDENITNVEDMREKGEVDEKASEKDVVVSDTEDTDIPTTMKPNMKVDISSNKTKMPDESIESEPEKKFTSVTVRAGDKPLERSVIDLELTEIPTDNERDGIVDEDLDMSEKTSEEVGLDIRLKYERKGLEKAGLEFDLNTVPSAFETEVSHKEDERLNLDIIPENDDSKTPATSTAALNAKHIEKDKALPQKTRLDVEIDVGKLDKDTEIYEKINNKVDLNIVPEEVSAPADEEIIHVSEAIDRDGKTVTPMETINIITRMPKLDEAVVPLATNKSELENKADIRIKSETMDIPEEEIQKRTPKVAPKWLPKVSEKEEPLPDEEMQQIYDEYVDEEQQPETTELEDSGTSVGIVLDDKPFVFGMEAPINDNFYVAKDEVMPFKPTSVEIDVVPRDNLDVDQVAKDTDKELMAILKPQTEKSTLSLETIQMDALQQEKRSYVSKEIDGDLHMDIVPFNEHPHIQEIIHVDLLKNDLAKSDKTEVDIDIIVPQPKKEYEISETLDEKVNLNIVPLDEDFHIHEKTDEKIEIELSPAMENIISNQTAIDIDIELPSLPKETETHESVDEKVNTDLLPSEEELDVYETPGEIIEVDISSEDEATTDVEPFDKETKIEEIPDEIEADNFDLPEMDFEVSAPAEEQIILVSEAIDREGTTVTPMETINIITRMPKLDDAAVPLTTYESELERKADIRIKSETMEIPEEEIQKRTPKVAQKWLPKVSEKEEPLPDEEMQQIYDEYVDEEQQPETSELENSGTSVGIVLEDKPFISGTAAPINDNFHVAEREVMPFKPTRVEIDVVPKNNLDVDQVAEDTDKELMVILKPQTEKSTLSLETIQMDALQQEKRTYVSKEIDGDLRTDIVPFNGHPHIQESLREVIHVDLLKNDLAKSDKAEVDIDIIVPHTKKEYEIYETLDEKVNLNMVPQDEDFHIHEKTDEKIEIELSQKMENIISNQTAIDIDIELPALPKETETRESVDEKVNIGLLQTEEDLDVYETPGEIIEVDISSEDEATTDVEPFDKETKIEVIPDEIEADNFDLPEMDFEVSAPAEEQIIFVSEAIDRDGTTLTPMEAINIITRMPKLDDAVVPLTTYESELERRADKIKSETIEITEEEIQKRTPKVAPKWLPKVSEKEEPLPDKEMQQIYDEYVDEEQQPETTEQEDSTSVGIVLDDKPFISGMKAPINDNFHVAEDKVMPFKPMSVEIDVVPKDNLYVDQVAQDTDKELMSILKPQTEKSTLSLETTQMDALPQEKRSYVSKEIDGDLHMDIVPFNEHPHIQESLREAIHVDLLKNDLAKSDKTEMDIDIIAPQPKKEYEISEKLDEKVNLNIVPLDEDFHIHEKTDEKIEIELSPAMENIISNQTAIDIDIELPALPKETETHESVDEKVNIGLLPSEEDLDVYETPEEIIEVDISSEDVATTDVVSEPFDKETKTEELPDEIEADHFDLPEMDFEVSAPAEEQLILVSEAIDREGKTLIPMETLEIIKRMPKKAETVIPVPTYESELVENADIQIRSDTINNLEEENMKSIPKVASKSVPNVSDMEENTPAEEVQEIFNESVDGEHQPETTRLEVQSVGIVPVDKTFTPEMEAPTQDSDLVSEVMPFTPGTIEIDMLPKVRVGVDENAENTNNEIMTIIKEGTVTSSVSLDTTQMDTPLQEKRTSISGEIGENLKMDIIPVDDNLNIPERIQEAIQIDILQNATTRSDTTEMDIDIIAPQAKKEYEIMEALDKKFNLDIVQVNEDLHVHEKTDAKLEIELSTNMDNVRSDKMTTDMQIDFSALSKETEINESIDEKINIGLLPTDDDLDVYEMPGEIIEVDISSEDETKSELTENSQVTNKGPAHEVKADEKISIDIPSVDELDDIVHSSGILTVDKTFPPGMEAHKQDKDLVSEAEIMPFTPGIIEIDMLPKDNVGVDVEAENTDKEIMTIFKAGTDISSLSLDNTQMDAPLQDKRTFISGEIGESIKMDITPVDDNLNIQERVQESIQIDILQNATTRSDTTEMDIDIIAPQPKKEYEISEKLDEKVNLNIVPLDEDFHIHEKTDEKIEIKLSSKMENIISDQTAIDIDIELPALPKETETHESVDEKVNIGLLPSEEDLDVYETPGEIFGVDISSEDEATTDVVSEPFDKETKIEELPDEIEADNFDLPEMDFEVSAPAENQLILVSEAIDREGKTLIPMETLEIIKRMPKKAETVIPIPTYESERVENADIQIRSDTIDNLEEENMKPIPKVASKSIPNVSDIEENIPAEEVQEIYNESVDGEQQPETTGLEVQSVGIVPVDKTFTPEMEAPTQDSDLVSEVMPFAPGIIEIDMLPKDRVGVDENAENTNNEIITIIKEGTVTSSVSLDTTQMDTPLQDKRTSISGEIGENLKMDIIPVDDNLNIQERVQESIQIDILQNDTTKSDKTEMNIDIIAPQAKKEYEISEKLDEKFNSDIVPVNEDLHVHEKTDAKLEIDLSTNMDNVRSDKMTTDMQMYFLALSKETEINESIDEKINIGLLPTDDDLDVYEMPGEIIEVDISSEDDTKSELTENSQVTNKGPAHEVKADEKINIDIPSVDELDDIVHSSSILIVDKTFAPGMEAPKQDKDLVSEAEIMPFTPGIIEIDMLPKDNVDVDEVAENTDKEIMTIFKAGTDISSLSLDNTQMDAPLQDKRTSISGEIGESMKMDIIPVDDNLNIQERVQEAIQIDILQNAATRYNTTEMDIDIIVPKPKQEYEISEKSDEKVNLNIVPLDEDFHIHEKTDEKIEIELSPAMENIISNQTAIDIDIELPALPKETETHESVDEKVNLGLLPSEEDLDVYETPGEKLPDEIEADNFDLPEVDFEVSAPAEEQLILVSEAIDREGKTLIPMETLEIIKRMPKKAETVIPVLTYESELVENADVQIRSDTIDNLEENMKPIPKVASKSIPNVSDMEENTPAEEVQEIYNESVDGEQQPKTTELEVQSVGIVTVDKTSTPEMEAPTQDSDLVSEVMPFTPGIIEIDMLPKDRVGVDENAENTNNEIMTIIQQGTVTSSVSMDTTQMDTPLQEKRTSISGEIGENLKMDIIPVDDNLNIQERVQESIQIDMLQNDTTKSDKTEMDIDIIAPQAKKEYEIMEALDEKFNLDIVPVNEDLHVHEKTDAKLEIELSTNMDNVRSDKMTTDMQIDFSALSKETEINESIDEKINIGLLPTDDDLDVYEMPGEIIEVDISSEDETKSELTETSQFTNKGPAHAVKADEKINIDIPSVNELDDIVPSSGILTVDKTFAPGMEAPKQDKDLVSEAEIVPFTPGIIEIDMLPKDNVGVDEEAENTDKEMMTIFKSGTDISSLSLDNTQMDAPLQDKRTSISGEIGKSMKMDIIPVDDNLNIQERVQESIQIDILQNATIRSDRTEMDIDIIVPQPKKEYEISEKLDEKVNLNIVPLDEDFHIHEKTDEKIEIELSPKMENIISDQTAIDIDIELPALPKETETHESVDDKLNIGLLPSEEELDVYETPGEIIEVDISSEDEATTDVVSEPFDKETKIEELPDEIEADNFDLPEMDFEVSAPAEEQLILVSEAIDREGKTLIPMETLEIIKRMPKKAETVIPVPSYESELVENADIQIRSDTIDTLEEENMKPIPKVASKSIPNVSDMEENIPAEEVQEIYNESVDDEQQPETTELEVQSVGIVPVDKTFTSELEAPTQDSDLVSEVMPFTPGTIEIDMLPKDRIGVDENAENTKNEIMTIIKEGTFTSSVSLDTTQMDTPLQEKRTSISGEIGENLKMDIIPVDDNLNIQERVQESIQIDILQNDTTKSDKKEMDIDIIAPQAKKEYEITEALDEKFNLDIVPVNEDLHVHEKTDAKLYIELSTNMDNVRSDKMTTDMQMDFSGLSKETEINESIDEKINIGLLPTDDDLDVYEMPGEIIEVDISSEDDTKSELTETSQVTNKGPAHEVKADEKINIDIPSVDEFDDIVYSSGIMPVDKTFAPGMEARKQDKDLVSEADIISFTPGIIEIDMLPKDNVGVDEVAENTDKEIMTIFKAGTDISSLSLDNTQMDAPLQDKRTSISGEIGERMKMDIIPVDDNLNIQERVQEAIQIDILQNATTRSDTTEKDIDIIAPQPKKEYEITEKLDEKVNLNIVSLDEDFHIHEKTNEKIEIELSPKMENIISDQTAIAIDIELPALPKETETHESVDEKVNIGLLPSEEDLDVYETPGEIIEVDISSEDEATTEVEPFDKETKIEEIPDEIEADNFYLPEMDFEVSAPAEEQLILVSEAIDRGEKTLIPMETLEIIKRMPKKAETVIPVPTYESGLVENADIQIRSDTIDNLEEENMKPIPKVASKSIPNVSDMEESTPADEVQEIYNECVDGEQQPETTELEVQSVGIVPVDKTNTPGMEAHAQGSDLVSKVMPFTPGIIEIDMLPKGCVGVDENAENTSNDKMTIIKEETVTSSLSLDNTQMDAPLQVNRTSISGEIGENIKMDITPVDDNLNIQERVKEAIQIDILQNATTTSDTTEMDIDIIVPQPKKEYEISETLDEKVDLNIVPLDEDFHIHEKTDEKIEIELFPKMENMISDQTAIDIDIELPALPKETETHESVDEKVNIGLLPTEEDLDVYETPGEIIEVDISSEGEATTDVEPFDKETKIEEIPDEIEADNFYLPEMDFEVSAPAEEQLIFVSEAIDREGKTLIPTETLEIIKRMPKKAEAVIPVPTYESELVENADIQIRSDTIDILEEENMKPIPKVASKSIPNVSDMEESIPADEVQEIYNESVDGEQQPETTELEDQSVGIVPVDKTFTPEMEAPTQDSDLVSEVMPFTPGIIEIDMLPKDCVCVDENAENTNNEIMTIIKEGTVTSSLSLDTTQMDTPLQEKRTTISGEIGENIKIDIVPLDEKIHIQERVKEAIQIDILQNDTTKFDKTEMEIDIIAPQSKKEHEISEALDEKFNLDIVPEDEDLHVHEKADAKLEIELSTNLDNVSSDKMATDIHIDFPALSKDTETSESIDEKFKIDLLPTDDDLDVYEMPGEYIEVDMSSGDDTKPELKTISQDIYSISADEVTEDEAISLDITSKDSDCVNVDVSSTNEIDLIPSQQIGDIEKVNQDVEIDVRKPLTALDISGDADEDVCFDLLPEMNHFEVSAPVEEQIVFMGEAIDSDGKTIIPMETIDITKRMPKMTTETVIPLTTYENELVDSADMQIKSDTKVILEEEQKKRTPKVASKSTPKVSEMEEILPDDEVQPIYYETVDAEHQPVTTELDDNVHSSGILPVDKAFEAPTQDKDLVSEAEVMPFTPGIIEIDLLPKNNVGVDKVAENTNKETMAIFRDGTDISSLSLDTTQMDTPLQEKRTSISGEIGKNIKMDIIPLDDNLNIQENVKEAIQIDILQNSVTDSDKTEIDIDIGMKAKKEYRLSETFDEKFNLDITPQDEDVHIHEKTDEHIEIELSTNMDNVISDKGATDIEMEFPSLSKETEMNAPIEENINIGLLPTDKDLDESELPVDYITMDNSSEDDTKSEMRDIDQVIDRIPSHKVIADENFNFDMTPVISDIVSTDGSETIVIDTTQKQPVVDLEQTNQDFEIDVRTSLHGLDIPDDVDETVNFDLLSDVDHFDISAPAEKQLIYVTEVIDKDGKTIIPMETIDITKGTPEIAEAVIPLAIYDKELIDNADIQIKSDTMDIFEEDKQKRTPKVASKAIPKVNEMEDFIPDKEVQQIYNESVDGENQPDTPELEDIVQSVGILLVDKTFASEVDVLKIDEVISEYAEGTLIEDEILVIPREEEIEVLFRDYDIRSESDSDETDESLDSLDESLDSLESIEDDTYNIQYPEEEEVEEIRTTPIPAKDQTPFETITVITEEQDETYSETFEIQRTLNIHIEVTSKDTKPSADSELNSSSDKTSRIIPIEKKKADSVCEIIEIDIHEDIHEATDERPKIVPEEKPYEKERIIPIKERIKTDGQEYFIEYPQEPQHDESEPQIVETVIKSEDKSEPELVKEFTREEIDMMKEKLKNDRESHITLDKVPKLISKEDISLAVSPEERSLCASVVVEEEVSVVEKHELEEKEILNLQLKLPVMEEIRSEENALITEEYLLNKPAYEEPNDKLSESIPGDSAQIKHTKPNTAYVEQLSAKDLEAPIEVTTQELSSLVQPHEVSYEAFEILEKEKSGTQCLKATGCVEQTHDLTLYESYCYLQLFGDTVPLHQI